MRGDLARLHLERLEPRLLLSGAPRIVSHDLPVATTELVTGVTLTLSDPVVGSDAQRRHLRIDAPRRRSQRGGRGRSPHRSATCYVDGSTQIDLAFQPFETLDLGTWKADGNLNVGGTFSPQLGDWRMATNGASVVHVSTESDFPSYYVSDSNLIDTPSHARLRVESDASDDMIGLIFSLKHRFNPWYDLGPDTFYALTWNAARKTRRFFAAIHVTRRKRG